MYKIVLSMLFTKAALYLYYKIYRGYLISNPVIIN